MVVPIWKNIRSLSNFNVCLAALVVNLAATAAMCVMSWSSPVLPMIIKPGAKIFVTKQQGALLSSIAALGACLGPFVTGRLADKYGRKMTLLGGMILLIATWSIVYTCGILAILMCARFFAGVCVGLVFGIVPMYISEIAPVHIRGSLGSIIHFFDCMGPLVENVGGFYVSYENLALLSAAVPLLCFFLLIWIPESPYYLQNCGKDDDAVRALRFFRGNVETSELQDEIEEMKISAKTMKENRGSIRSMFSTIGNLKCVYYAAALVLFQQFTGICVLVFYSETIFIETGSTISPKVSAVILYIVMALTSLVTVMASSIFKMRTLLSFSSIGITLSMAALGGYFYAKETNAELIHSLDWIPLVSLVTYTVTYTLGWGPLIWCITAVIFPANLKAMGCGMCASFVWFLAFLLTSTFQSIDPAIGFSVFGCATFISFFFVRLHLPETKGKTFQEIQDVIQASVQKSHRTPL